MVVVGVSWGATMEGNCHGLEICVTVCLFHQIWRFQSIDVETNMAGKEARGQISQCNLVFSFLA